MVIEPFVRMGPPPRSLAAEAKGCFMVRLLRGVTEYKVAARVCARDGRLPSVRLCVQLPSSTRSALLKRRRSASLLRRTRLSHSISLRYGEQTMPRGRQPDGEQALSNAERRARYRARRRTEQPPALVRYRRPADRRARPQRWHAAVTELVTLQAEYAAWLDALPDKLRDSATAEALQAIVDLDLDLLTAIVPPRGYGRD